MGGRNPYIGRTDVAPPRVAYTVVAQVEETGETVEVAVDPAAIPYGHDGLPGSLLDVLLGAGVGVDHACGGVCACSTCHVIVEQGIETCNAASDAEEDMLDTAAGVTSGSRLACQTVPDGSAEVHVRVPAWNRNAVAEEHH